MKHYNECSLAEKEEIDTLCKYWVQVLKQYEKEMQWDELWEEQYKLRQVVKKKIIAILNK